MAIPHFNLSSQSRRAGASAIAKAAYNAGVVLRELSGERQEYNKKGGIRFRELMYSDSHEGQKMGREEFWQAVELSEKRKDACVSREIQAALPCELSYAQNLALAQSFTRKVLQRYGLAAADLAIHYPSQYRRKSDSNFAARKPNASGHENPHFHLLFPDRDKNGKKLRVFCNNPDELKSLRKMWENHVNEHLSRAGVDMRISMDTLKKQIADLGAEIEKLKAVEAEIRRELAAIAAREKEGEKMQISTEQKDRKGMEILHQKADARMRGLLKDIHTHPRYRGELPAILRENLRVLSGHKEGDKDEALTIIGQKLAFYKSLQIAETLPPEDMPQDARIYHAHADRVARMGLEPGKANELVATRLRAAGHSQADALRIMRISGDKYAMGAVASIYNTDYGDQTLARMSKYAEKWKREEAEAQRDSRQTQTQQGHKQQQTTGPRM